MHFESTDQFYLVDVDNDTCDEERVANINVEIEENVRSGSSIGQRIKLCVPTKNGIHFICAPFDVASFKEKYPDIDVHKSNPTILYCLKDQCYVVCYFYDDYRMVNPV